MTEPNPNRCPACGKAIHPGDRFCAACGQQLGEPGFVPPATQAQAQAQVPAPAAPRSTAAADPPPGDPWVPAPAPADAAWMPPGRAATAAPRDTGDPRPTAPEAAHSGGGQVPSLAEAVGGEGVTAADPTSGGAGVGTVDGWGPATTTIAPITSVYSPPGATEVAVAEPAPRPDPGDDEDANWFATTRPSTLVAWGLIAVVGGLLLGAIGQIDPTDTLVIVAFLLVPLGLLLLPLALVCWVVQKATGRR